MFLVHWFLFLVHSDAVTVTDCTHRDSLPRHIDPTPTGSIDKHTRVLLEIGFDMQAVISRLSYWYDVVTHVVLERQHAVTGLFPASTAITTHGNYLDAWVRYVNLPLGECVFKLLLLLLL